MTFLLSRLNGALQRHNIGRAVYAWSFPCDVGSRRNIVLYTDNAKRKRLLLFWSMALKELGDNLKSVTSFTQYPDIRGAEHFYVVTEHHASKIVEDFPKIIDATGLYKDEGKERLPPTSFDSGRFRCCCQIRRQLVDLLIAIVSKPCCAKPYSGI